MALKRIYWAGQLEINQAPFRLRSYWLNQNRWRILENWKWLLAVNLRPALLAILGAADEVIGLNYTTEHWRKVLSLQTRRTFPRVRGLATSGLPTASLMIPRNLLCCSNWGSNQGWTALYGALWTRQPRLPIREGFAVEVVKLPLCPTDSLLFSLLVYNRR